MRTVLFLSVLCLARVGAATIYGTDDRKEAYEEPSVAALMSSVAMMQGSNFFTKNEANNTYDVDFPAASDSVSQIGLCADEKFADQKAGYLNCTGFLVADDVMVTAGHCMIFSHSPLPKVVIENETTSMCENFSWMFDFQRSNGKSENINGVPADSVYRCEKVLYAELFGYPLDSKGEILLPVDPALGQDFAIVKLDRKVTGRQPLKISDLPVGLMEPVSTLGYPMGLPMKYTGNAKVSNVSFANYIVTDLDVIGGNSGGPMLNSAGEVNGVIVRSFPGEDFIWDEKNQCHRPYVCPVIGKGDCAKADGHPVGSHSNRMGPVVSKLKELGIL